MKAFLVSGALASALLLAGCGGEAGAGNSGSDSATGGASGTSAAAIPAPNGGDWTATVTQTAEGGFLMGNPNAPVKLVEYASMTCPHCGTFAEEGMPALRDNYIKTGRVSLEFRNFVRDPADLAASLLARCGGAQPFYPMTEQMFAAQDEWFGKLQSMSPADQQRLSALPPNQVTVAVAQQAGLDQFARVRGLPAEKAQQCLSNQAEIERLTQMSNTAIQQYQIPGTPSFLINGKLVENSADWSSLEPRLKEAL